MYTTVPDGYCVQYIYMYTYNACILLLPVTYKYTTELTTVDNLNTVVPLLSRFMYVLYKEERSLATDLSSDTLVVCDHSVVLENAYMCIFITVDDKVL